MAHEPTPQDPLKTVQSMYNLILVETGKVFRHASKRDPKNVARTNVRLKETITSARQRYDKGLDEIEIEILRAKAVIERDLATIRARKLEKELAASAAKFRAATPAKSTEPVTLTAQGQAKTDTAVNVSRQTAVGTTLNPTLKDATHTSDIRSTKNTSTMPDETPQNFQMGNSILPSTNGLQINTSAAPSTDRKTTAEVDTGTAATSTFDMDTALDFDSMFPNENNSANPLSGGGNDSAEDLSSLILGLNEYAQETDDGNGGDFDVNNLLADFEASGDGSFGGPTSDNIGSSIQRTAIANVDGTSDDVVMGGTNGGALDFGLDDGTRADGGGEFGAGSNFLDMWDDGEAMTRADDLDDLFEGF